MIRYEVKFHFSNSRLKQNLQQKLLQKLSPQQIQLIKLLEIPTLQLEQRIMKEIEENPALEEGDDELQVEADFDKETEEDYEEQYSDEFSIEDYLPDDDPSHMFERAAIEAIVADGQLMVYRHEGFWMPMDTSRDYHYLNDLWRDDKAPWKV